MINTSPKIFRQEYDDVVLKMLNNRKPLKNDIKLSPFNNPNYINIKEEKFHFKSKSSIPQTNKPIDSKFIFSYPPKRQLTFKTSNTKDYVQNLHQIQNQNYNTYSHMKRKSFFQRTHRNKEETIEEMKTESQFSLNKPHLPRSIRELINQSIESRKEEIRNIINLCSYNKDKYQQFNIQIEKLNTFNLNRFKIGNSNSLTTHQKNYNEIKDTNKKYTSNVCSHTSMKPISKTNESNTTKNLCNNGIKTVTKEINYSLKDNKVNPIQKYPDNNKILITKFFCKDENLIENQGKIANDNSINLINKITNLINDFLILSNQTSEISNLDYYIKMFSLFDYCHLKPKEISEKLLKIYFTILNFKNDLPIKNGIDFIPLKAFISDGNNPNIVKSILKNRFPKLG